jgi:hypothetical protein
MPAGRIAHAVIHGKIAGVMSLAPRRILALLVLAGYCGVSYAVQNLYPFSTFDMYSRHAQSASRVIARDASGRAAEVSRFVGWRCDGAIDASAERCRDFGRFDYTPYKDDEAIHWIASHGGEGGAPIDLVRRIWWLAPDGERTDDCLLARCRATHEDARR